MKVMKYATSENLRQQEEKAKGLVPCNSKFSITNVQIAEKKHEDDFKNLESRKKPFLKLILPL